MRAAGEKIRNGIVIKGNQRILSLKNGFALFDGRDYVDTFATLGDARLVADML